MCSLSEVVRRFNVRAVYLTAVTDLESLANDIAESNISILYEPPARDEEPVRMIQPTWEVVDAKVPFEMTSRLRMIRTVIPINNDAEFNMK